MIRFRTIAFCFAAFAVAAFRTSAGDIGVPIDVQLEIFSKIWKLDRTFKPGPLVEVAVLYQQEHRPSSNVANQFLAAVHASKHPIHVTLIDLDEQDSVAARVPSAGFHVIYVAPLRGIDVSTIANITRAHGIRTITGVPQYVSSGLAVGIGLLKQRPLVIINLTASRAEGSEFRSQLLLLSRVIEDGGAEFRLSKHGL